MIVISAFQRVPAAAQGLVRDLRVRWALEEAGLPYQARLLSREDQSSSSYRGWQPFGQVPAFEEDGLVMFESGAIALHVAARSRVLLPDDRQARARAVTWVFAALNTMEGAIQQLAELDLFCRGQEWTRERRPQLEKRVKTRLGELAASLGERDYLDGQFTVGDLMMTSVLRILRHTDLVAEVPSLKSYQARCESRPAFQRALNAQMEAFATA